MQQSTLHLQCTLPIAKNGLKRPGAESQRLVVSNLHDVAGAQGRVPMAILSTI